jgi:hypothetical protein
MSEQISRRVTLGWIAAASSTAFAMAGCDSETAKGPQTGNWRDIALQPVTAKGYGLDPNLVEPSVPWPLTLDQAQRGSLKIAAALMLPADDRSPSGGALNLDAFIDEWISAPYEAQQADRALIVSGLAWMDRESTQRFGKSFAQASDAQRREIFDLVAFKNKVATGYEKPAAFFVRMRALMLAGFYSLPEGMKDIGYMGNQPSVGPYPGPTKEALAHLNAALTKLNLKPV